MDIKKFQNISIKIIDVQERIDSKSERTVYQVQYKIFDGKRELSIQYSLQVSDEELAKEIEKLNTSTGIKYSIAKVDKQDIVSKKESHSFIVKNSITKETFEDVENIIAKIVVKKVKNIQESDIIVDIINREEVFSLETSGKITKVDYTIEIENQLISQNEMKEVTAKEIKQEFSAELNKNVSIFKNINVKKTVSILENIDVKKTVSVDKTFSVTLKEKITKSETKKVAEIVKKRLEELSITNVTASFIAYDKLINTETSVNLFY